MAIIWRHCILLENLLVSNGVRIIFYLGRIGILTSIGCTSFINLSKRPLGVIAAPLFIIRSVLRHHGLREIALGVVRVGLLILEAILFFKVLFEVDSVSFLFCKKPAHKSKIYLSLVSIFDWCVVVIIMVVECLSHRVFDILMIIIFGQQWILSGGSLHFFYQ